MDLPKNEQDELRRLREENARINELLTSHGIAWEELPTPEPAPATTESAPVQSPLTTDDKVALFRRLFRGREDVYPQRWESAKGTSGYSPACGNEWKPGICHKPRVKCGDCKQRQFLPVTDRVIYDHLAGKQTIGVYPLLSDDRCYFLATDFDEADRQEDANAFLHSCREIGIPAALEISRSGNGAHVWIFFAEAVPACEARQLGAAPAQLEVWPRMLPAPDIPQDSPIQDVFRILANDATRNRQIVGDVLSAYREGRKVLVLTERTDHLPLLLEGLGNEVEHCFILHGRL